MSDLLQIPPLLFAQARIEAMPLVVQTVEVVEAAPTMWTSLSALAGLAIAVVAGLVLRVALRRRNKYRQLFNELCRAHQLSSSQARALRKLSKQLQIANPNRLFLETELWGAGNPDAGSAHAHRRSSGKAHAELDKLRQQLFTSSHSQPLLK